MGTHGVLILAFFSGVEQPSGAVLGVSQRNTYDLHRGLPQPMTVITVSTKHCTHCILDRHHCH